MDWDTETHRFLFFYVRACVQCSGLFAFVLVYASIGTLVRMRVAACCWTLKSPVTEDSQSKPERVDPGSLSGPFALRIGYQPPMAGITGNCQAPQASKWGPLDLNPVLPNTLQQALPSLSPPGPGFPQMRDFRLWSQEGCTDTSTAVGECALPGCTALEHTNYGVEHVCARSIISRVCWPCLVFQSVIGVKP